MAARRLQFLQNHAEIYIQRGKQNVPALRQALRYQTNQIFRHHDFSSGSKRLLKDTVFQYLPSQDPVVLSQEPESHTSTSSWRAAALTVEASEAQTRAQSATMVPGILWIELTAMSNSSSCRRGVFLQKGEPI